MITLIKLYSMVDKLNAVTLIFKTMVSQFAWSTSHCVRQESLFYCLMEQGYKEPDYLEFIFSDMLKNMLTTDIRDKLSVSIIWVTGTWGANIS